MEEQGYIYKCTHCGNTAEPSEHEKEPMCCEKIMVKELLPPCTTADHPEMTRNSDDDNACDDGRGKNPLHD